MFTDTKTVIGIKDRHAVLACRDSEIDTHLRPDVLVPIRTVVWRKCRQCVGEWPRIGTVTTYGDGTSRAKYDNHTAGQRTNISVVNGSLMIKHLRYEDEALYVCEFTSGTSKRIEYQLHVYSTSP